MNSACSSSTSARFETATISTPLHRLVGPDRIEQFPDFHPRKHFGLTLADAELSLEERAACSVDDIELKL